MYIGIGLNDGEWVGELSYIAERSRLRTGRRSRGIELFRSKGEKEKRSPTAAAVVVGRSLLSVFYKIYSFLKQGMCVYTQREVAKRTIVLHLSRVHGHWSLTSVCSYELASVCARVYNRTANTS